jgi:hypothetical protein
MLQSRTTIVAPPTRTCVSSAGHPLLLRVRLLRKFAERLNGIDLSGHHVGDCLDLSPKDARMLVAEGWAEIVEVRSSEAACKR